MLQQHLSILNHEVNYKLLAVCSCIFNKDLFCSNTWFSFSFFICQFYLTTILFNLFVESNVTVALICIIVSDFRLSKVQQYYPPLRLGLSHTRRICKQIILFEVVWVVCRSNVCGSEAQSELVLRPAFDLWQLESADPSSTMTAGEGSYWERISWISSRAETIFSIVVFIPFFFKWKSKTNVYLLKYLDLMCFKLWPSKNYVKILLYYSYWFHICLKYIALS